ncbi:MAG: hypothetical protein IID45_07580 [Planctomycetes bacterium]|nr:hypothetical protein [Planctomycetota bacterium]
MQRRRSEARRYSAAIRKLNRRRASLLMRGGAANREEFERRALAATQKQELADLLAMAEEELQEAAATEPKLAVVEEDLQAYDADENSECIRALELELTAIADDLQSTHEDRGRIKQSLHELENDRRRTQLLYERAQVAERLKRTTERWLGAELAERTLEAVRSRYERNCQPQTLSVASRYFQRLTDGRYGNIWTPLGERRLCVDDENNRTFQIGQLSGGTREQLFLAVRLAIVEQFRSRGIELPLILDDVLANFDERRVQCTLETLREAGEMGQGQQILLFTCHGHLARLGESMGIPVTPLPEFEHRRSERLAG